MVVARKPTMDKEAYWEKSPLTLLIRSPNPCKLFSRRKKNIKEIRAMSIKKCDSRRIMIGEKVKKGLQKFKMVLQEEFSLVLRHTIDSKAREAGFQDMTALARAQRTSEPLLYRATIVEKPSNARFPGEFLNPYDF
jgi:ribosomal protein L14E/L6E/L27E